MAYVNGFPVEKVGRNHQALLGSKKEGKKTIIIIM